MFTVHTYNGTPVEGAFYIASKGDHAGQPSREPWANSFVVKADEVQLNTNYLYYAVLNMHNLKRFRPYLKGSVIPFLSVVDVRTVIRENLGLISQRNFERTDVLFTVITFSKELKLKPSTVKAVQRAAELYLMGAMKR